MCVGGRVLCWDSWIWSWRWKEAEINTQRTPRGSRRPTNYTEKTTTTKTTRQRLFYNPKKRQLIILGRTRVLSSPEDEQNSDVPSSTLCDCSSQTIPVFSVSFGGCCCCCCLQYSYCCCWAILFQKGAGTALLIDIRRRRRRADRHIQMNG